MAENNENKIQIRNSTNDFLVFTKENGGDGVDVLVADENVWLTQKSLCSLYDASKSNMSEHLTAIFTGGELDENSVVRKFRTTASDGKTYSQKYYSLQAIISVGFKVNSQKAIRFRAWASDVLANFAMKGYVLDKERLKNDRIFSKNYFERLLEDIREIRLSERKFYQKIADIYSLAYDYDPKSQETLLFFKTVQNKLHFAIHSNTAAEIIVARANAEKENMGLTTWESTPKGKIRKSDVIIAKNYLFETEMRSLERIVMAYLEFAEFQAERQIPMSRDDWKKRLDLFLQTYRACMGILRYSNEYSNDVMEATSKEVFEKQTFSFKYFQITLKQLTRISVGKKEEKIVSNDNVRGILSFQGGGINV